MTRPPEHLPGLGRHAHVGFEDGACLMEYVSVLAGTAFTDAPGCTHPVLATIARLVNDATTDAGRHHLVPLAPALVGLTRGGPLLTPRLVAHCLRAALATGPRKARRLRRRLRAAERREHRLGQPGTRAALLRRTDPLYQRGPAMHALIATIRAFDALEPSRRDAALRVMLTDAIDIAAHLLRQRSPSGGCVSYRT